MRRKLADESGFTLVELLAAVVILMLLGLILNSGLQMAVHSYQTMTAQSETELLLSTLADAVTDELRYADDVTEQNGVITYTSASFGEGISLTVSDGQAVAGGKKLLPDGAYGKGRYVVDVLEISYAEPNFKVHLEVKEKDGTISAAADLTVGCLNP
jgi:prepilin-type N-terminal cleavage/methylation domain-containing protein